MDNQDNKVDSWENKVDNQDNKVYNWENKVDNQDNKVDYTFNVPFPLS